jgi:hypothetical protein
MARRDRQIGIVPIWQPKIDRRLFVLALLALVDQLVAEEAATEARQLSAGKAQSDEGERDD